MILCDSNVWLALALSGHAHHATARTWFDAVEEPASVRFCRATQQTLLRLLTNSAVLAPYRRAPLTNDEAWSVYEAFLRDDRISFQAVEPPETERRWAGYARRATASPKLWMDAYLAGFAAAGGLTVVTTDAAFAQFDDLDVHVLTT